MTSTTLSAIYNGHIQTASELRGEMVRISHLFTWLDVCKEELLYVDVE